MAKDDNKANQSAATPAAQRDPSAPRTQREKLLSAAEAVGLKANDAWDDQRLEAEIREASKSAQHIEPNL